VGVVGGDQQPEPQRHVHQTEGHRDDRREAGEADRPAAQPGAVGTRGKERAQHLGQPATDEVGEGAARHQPDQERGEQVEDSPPERRPPHVQPCLRDRTQPAATRRQRAIGRGERQPVGGSRPPPLDVAEPGDPEDRECQHEEADPDDQSADADADQGRDGGEPDDADECVEHAVGGGGQDAGRGGRVLHAFTLGNR
jgi:hypothetical protein